MYFNFVSFSNIDLKQKLKSLLVADKGALILQNQYHGFWWPGHTRSQGISCHSIDLVLLGFIPAKESETVFKIHASPQVWGHQLLI